MLCIHDAGSPLPPGRPLCPGQYTLLTGAKRQVSGHFPRLSRRGRSPKRRDVRGRIPNNALRSYRMQSNDPPLERLGGI